MSKIRILILIAFAAIAVVITSILAKPRTPRIHVREPVIDLGVVDETVRERKIEFHIENLGKECLQLTKVQARCPCLNLKLDRTSVLYGQKAILTGTFKPVSKPGDWSDDVLLFSNDPTNPVIKLCVKAFMELNCVVVPTSIMINNLKRNESREAEIEVLGPSNDGSFKVLGVSTINSAVESLELNEVALKRKANRRRKWKVRLLIKSRDTDIWKDTVTISTSSSKVPNLEVPITVRQVPDFRIKPRIVCLRQTRQNAVPVESVEIIATERDAPLKASHISAPEWLAVTADAVAGHSIRLHIKASEEQVSQNANREGKIIVTTDGNTSTINIPVLLFVTK